MALLKNFNNEAGYCITYNNNNFPLKYKINLKYNLFIQELISNEIETDIEWLVESWTENEIGHIVKLKSIKHEVIKSFPQMDELSKILLKFNYPLTDVILQLNKQGQPISVLNQDEIHAKWMELVVNDFDGFENDEDAIDIFIGGEIDFSKSLPVINSSLIYILFLSPIYGHKKEPESAIQSIVLDSQLFPQNSINMHISERLVSESDIDFGLAHTAYGNLHDYGKAELYFNKLYKQMTEKPFSYFYSINADYRYKHNGALSHCYAIIKEQANESYISQTIFNINLIE